MFRIEPAKNQYIQTNSTDQQETMLFYALYFVVNSQEQGDSD
ncbi:hypothetical protein L902_24180 [Agrobacterium radiobacter DSM 30147]|nr:hypothetical protein L902_24180 [Agrobacterium radiobacter DSM 30147]KVK45946.1 hypothetical protein L904_24700 [Agrobacterium sp. LY4]